MSYTVSTDVFCDGKDPHTKGGPCPEWVHGVTGPRTHRREASIEAIKAGWTVIKGKHFCPACTERMK